MYTCGIRVGTVAYIGLKNDCLRNASWRSGMDRLDDRQIDDRRTQHCSVSATVSIRSAKTL